MRRDLAICLLLALLTAAAYCPVVRNDFVNYDDDGYVTANEHVQDGLTWQGVKWAFTSTQQANWHPLTWLSHMLDCQLFGSWPGGHHLDNLALHIANSVLLYLVFRSVTGAVWRSAMVAALFALHPLHVESVAWVAERKDVLSTFFGLLAMGAYVRYVDCKLQIADRKLQNERNRPRPPSSLSRRLARSPLVWYLFAFVLLALGLLAKPMLVTLPLVFLLLDYWPLGQFHQHPRGGRRRDAPDVWQRALPLLIEKIPLLVLVGISSVVTYYAQHTGGAVVSVEHMGLTVRIGNALLAYVGYIAKMLVPLDLAPFYPHAWEFQPLPTIGAFLLLIVVSAVFLWGARQHRYLAVGWLWYLGTLVPVIGLVQVGAQSMADRYTYLPIVGLFVVLVWSVADVAANSDVARRALLPLAVTVLAVCGVLTSRQAGYWSDTETLFTHALDVTGPNPVAHNNLGIALANRGERDAAEKHYRAALALRPNYLEAHGNLANLMAARNRLDEAVKGYRVVLQLNSNDNKVDKQLGLALVRQEKLPEAEASFREALRKNPGSAAAYDDLAMILQHRGKTAEALEYYQRAVRLRPNLPRPWNNMAWIRAVHPDPQFRNGAEAVELAQRAMRLSGTPDANTLDTLAAAYAEAGQFDKAIATAEEAVALTRNAKQTELTAELEGRLALFRKGRPYRDPKLKGP